MKKLLVVAALAAAVVLVPVASAKTTARVKLSLVLLPKAALGPSAHGLALAHDSGPVPNNAVASRTLDSTAGTFKKLGRVNGYALDYGAAYSGGSGITDVRTGIEQYKTAADAKKGLAFWRKQDARLSALNSPGFAVTNVSVKVPSVGKKRFADLVSFTTSNTSPVSTLDEQVADGSYVLEATVSAGSPSAAKALAPKLAKKLDARLHLALAGRLHGKPVKLPAKQKAGAPAGGPDLAAMALTASDVSGSDVVANGYVVDPLTLDFVDLPASSFHNTIMLPAGSFDFLFQVIEWHATANEAAFTSDFINAVYLGQPGATALDLSSLGDAAQGSILEDAQNGSTAAVTFSNGRLSEFLVMAALNGTIDSTDVTNVATTAAGKIDAGLGG